MQDRFDIGCAVGGPKLSLGAKPGLVVAGDDVGVEAEPCHQGKAAVVDHPQVKLAGDSLKQLSDRPAWVAFEPKVACKQVFGSGGKHGDGSGGAFVDECGDGAVTADGHQASAAARLVRGGFDHLSALVEGPGNPRLDPALLQFLHNPEDRCPASTAPRRPVDREADPANRSAFGRQRLGSPGKLRDLIRPVQVPSVDHHALSFGFPQANRLIQKGIRLTGNGSIHAGGSPLRPTPRP